MCGNIPFNARFEREERLAVRPIDITVVKGVQHHNGIPDDEPQISDVMQTSIVRLQIEVAPDVVSKAGRLFVQCDQALRTARIRGRAPDTGER